MTLQRVRERAHREGGTLPPSGMAQGLKTPVAMPRGRGADLSNAWMCPPREGRGAHEGQGVPGSGSPRSGAGTPAMRRRPHCGRSHGGRVAAQAERPGLE